MAFQVDPSYVEVAERIADFREKHPEGSLRPANPERPFEILTLGDRLFVVYVAAAYRTPDDPAPGIGVAWEPFPGKTTYTKDSELQNAETSAWGRAIVASLASTSKKIASVEEVRNRSDVDQPQPAPQPSRPAPFAPRRRPPPTPTPTPEALEQIAHIKQRLAKLDEPHLHWARGIAKEEGIGPLERATADDLAKLEGILNLAEMDEPADNGAPGDNR